MTGTPRPPRITRAAFAAGATRVDALPAPTHLEIAFAGRSNVGKSSLINALVHRKNLVRTSSTPGCTRQISLFDIETASRAALTFADLPGYGYAKRSKAERSSWGPLVESYLLERPSLAMVVVLFDVRRGLQPEERDVLELAGAAPRTSRRPLTTLLVATKTDKVPKSARTTLLARVAKDAGRPVLGVSRADEAGREALWQHIWRGLNLESEQTENPAPPPEA